MVTEPKAPPKTTPTPTVEPVRRYSPTPDHCPSQIVRTVRRIKRVIEDED